MADKCEDIFSYDVPKQIVDRIPEYFYYALGGECVSVFGINALIPDDDGFYILNYCSGEAGWYRAFKATCIKLDMKWLLDYWNILPWYHSDIFDEWMADEVIRRFENFQSASASPYYLYLIEKQKDS